MTDRREVAEHSRLEPLVGRWHTKGRTKEMPGAPAVDVDATDTYEWLPGGYGLLHVVDARMGQDRVEGAEIIGYDAASSSFRTLYFGNDGSAAYSATMTDEDGTRMWRMMGETMRFTGSFSPDGKTITGYWELSDDGQNWQRWMDIRLTKEPR
jgi:hypothetical protein